MNYPRLQAIWPLTPHDIEQYTQALQDFAELVNPRIGARLVPNDQEDDPVLETALSGRAHVLCTLDRHFQHRMVLKTCSEHGIQVLTDIELLSILRDVSRPSAEEYQGTMSLGYFIWPSIPKFRERRILGAILRSD